MSAVEANLSNEEGAWIVTVVTASGRTQRYTCTSEEQAQNLVTLFRTPPKPRQEKSEAKTPTRLGWVSRLVKAG